MAEALPRLNQWLVHRISNMNQRRHSSTLSPQRPLTTGIVLSDAHHTVDVNSLLMRQFETEKMMLMLLSRFKDESAQVMSSKLCTARSARCCDFVCTGWGSQVQALQNAVQMLQKKHKSDQMVIKMRDSTIAKGSSKAALSNSSTLSKEIELLKSELSSKDSAQIATLKARDIQLSAQLRECQEKLAAGDQSAQVNLAQGMIELTSALLEEKHSLISQLEQATTKRPPSRMPSPSSESGPVVEEMKVGSPVTEELKVAVQKAARLSDQHLEQKRQDESAMEQMQSKIKELQAVIESERSEAAENRESMEQYKDESNHWERLHKEACQKVISKMLVCEVVDLVDRQPSCKRSTRSSK